MAETIKTALSLDASLYVAGMKKASSALSGQMQKEKQYFDQNNRMSRYAGQRSGGAAGSMGFLAFSQAVEDAQYGMNGILNNIPSMVMGFGGSMGLAGALSLTAVAALAAYKAMYRLAADPAIVDWSKREASGQKAYADALETSNRRLSEQKFQAQTAADIAEKREKANQQMEKSIGLDQVKLQVIQLQRQELEKQRAAEDELLAARAKGGIVSDSGAAVAQALQDRKRAMDDLAASQQNVTKLAAEYQRVWEGIANERGPLQVQAGIAGKDLEQAEKSLAWQEAMQKKLKTQLEGTSPVAGGKTNKDFATLRSELADTEVLIKKSREIVTLKKAEVQLAEELLAKSTSTGQASKQQLDTLIGAERVLQEDLRRRIKLLGEIQQIEQASRAADNWKAWQAAVKEAAQGGVMAREAGGQLVDQAKMDPAQAAARRKWLEEEAVLALARNGNLKQSNELREEIQLRREAKDLAEEINVSEEKAKAMLQQRKAAEKENAGLRSNLSFRTAERARERAEAREQRKEEARIKNRRGKGAGIQDAAAAAAAAAAKPANQDPTLKYWEEQIGLQKTLVGAFQKLGIV